MKRFKMRFASVLLSIFVLVNSVFVPALNVQAVEITSGLTVIESLLALFGLEIGLGNQSKFFQNSEFDSFITAVANGETVSVPAYGDVNFSDGGEIYKFMAWANALSLTAANNDVMTLSKMLDSTSYYNTGTSATNAMQQQISALVGDYNGTSEALAEDVRDTFTVITGGASGGNDDNDDEENDEEADNDDNSDNVMTPKRWDLFTAVMSTFIFGASEKFNEFVDSFSTPAETKYQEYSSTFGDLPEQYFNGFYTMNADGKYVIRLNAYNIGNEATAVVDASFDFKVVGLHSPESIIVSICRFSGDSLQTYSLPCNRYRNDTLWSSKSLSFYDYNSYFNCNFPVYSSEDAALAALQNDDFSDADNLLNVVSYPDFKKVAPSAFDTLANNVNKWMDTNPSIDDFPVAVPGILDIANTVVGTPEAVPEIDDAIADTAGIKSDPDGEPDNDTDTDSGKTPNYTGILGKILQVLKDILNAILGKILTVMEAILDAVKAILSFLEGMFKAAFVPDYDYWQTELDIRVDALEDKVSILTLPLSIITLVMGVFLDSGSIGDFILTIPELTVKGNVIFEGFSFNVSEFVRQDMFKTFYNMYLMITDIMIIFCIGNYAARKFTTIIEGGR